MPLKQFETNKKNCLAFHINMNRFIIASHAEQ